jgi:ABC-type Fe3+-citrate transport system substrate-binding protein
MKTAPFAARSLPVVLIIGLTCGLAACGADSSDDQSSTHNDAAVQAVSTDDNLPQCGKDTREIKHERGTTKITGTPKRVVVLEFSFVDAAVQSGVTPIGIADDDDPKRLLPALREKVGDYTSVGLRETPNMQVILGLKPDLIIADSERQEGIYDQLTKIAPTVEFPSLNANYQQTLNSEQLAAVALNRCDEFRQSLDAHTAFMKAAAQAVPSDEKRKTLFAIGTDKIFTAFSQAYFTDDVLASVGIPASLDGKDGVASLEMNLETLTSTKPDVMFLARPKDTATIDEGWESNPLWKSIPAVEKKQVFMVDQNAWSRSRGIAAAELIATQAIKDLYDKTVSS